MPVTNLFPILSAAPRPHETFAAARELESRLRAAVRGEVRFDAGSRALYATDASNYRQTPIGVVTPFDAADVEATITACSELGAAILPRGGGTSLAGQCCNVAVVLDFSQHMRRLHSLDPDKKLAIVEPGIVLDRVREAAEVHHLTFAPDPATHSRCTIGGMIGNNSCGTHSVMGGLTANNIRSLDIVLADGTRMTVGATSDEEVARIIAAGGRPAQIYAGMRRIRDRYGDEIRRRFPKIPRRVSGYNLDELLPEKGFQVARALVGSEGTLATVVRATLDLMHSPPCRRLVVLSFKDAFLAADAVPEVTQHSPIGLEGIDDMLLDFMRRKHLAVNNVKLLPEGGGFLLCEFGAETEEEADAKAKDFEAAAKQFHVAPLAVRHYSPEEAERVWTVRESALGALVFVPGEPHRWEGWEDAAVPPERLGSYLREIQTLLHEFGYSSPMYGHFGQGCVHMRINFDLESTSGISRYREFIDRAADVVVAHGGSLSGEHGDGQSRGALLPKMFGPELMQAFREFKGLWDPENRMNPGKLIDTAAEVYQPTDNLRLGSGYQSPRPATYFQFPDDHGSFGEATLRCVGVGACRKADTGTMCPSYMATGEEQHSTRGRAHLLFEMLEGRVLDSGWQSESVREALDLCLSCKACKTECPVNVDMATYKAEFLAHYYEHHARRLQHYAFGFMDRMARWSSLIPGLTPRVANLPLALPGIANLIKATLGVAQQRRLPRFAPRSFRSEWHAHSSDQDGKSQTLSRSQDDALKGHGFSRSQDDALKGHGLSRSQDDALKGHGLSRSQDDALKGHGFSRSQDDALKGHGLGRSQDDALKGHGFSGNRQNALKGHGLSGGRQNALKGLGLGRSQDDALKGHGFSRAEQNDQRAGASAPEGRPVLLWPDTWNNYYHPQSLHAAARVLTTAGFSVEVPRRHLCCGRPLYDFGFLPQARAYLERILRELAPQIDAGLPFVFLEPSCATVFRDELISFFPDDERARRLRDQTLLLSQLLVQHAPDFTPAQHPGAKIVLHGHCHHKSDMKMTDEADLLRRTGAEVELLDSGCCGMAGPFGFERDKYEVSQALGERVLLPAVRAAAPETILVADGFSCREQISQNTKRRAVHFAEVIAGEAGSRV